MSYEIYLVDKFGIILLPTDLLTASVRMLTELRDFANFFHGVSDRAQSPLTFRVLGPNL